MVRTLGIDLGTTNTVVTYMENGKFNYLNFGREDSLASCLIYKDGKIDVGSKALKKSVVYSENFIKSAKTFMGDFDKEWSIDDKTFTPTSVATEVLQKVKQEAAKQLGETDFEVVITVPAYFNANQREETKNAGIAAGLDVKQIITEPVAAAIAYGFEDESNGVLFVVDIGGGTFDVSILKLTGGLFESLALDGDAKLGGDNFDAVIIERLYSEVRKKTGVDLEDLNESGLSKEEYSNVCQRLLVVAEEVKIGLSASTDYEVDVMNIIGDQSISFIYTREDFEDEVRPLLHRIRKTIKNCLTKANFSVAEIDKIILVGGTSKIPSVQALVQDEFGKLPYADRDLSKLVAMGAALLAEDTETITVKDIIAHSLGIEIVGNRFEKILISNMPYPCVMKKEFTTAFDYQDEVTISVFEGEDDNNVDNNAFFGSFILPNIQKALKGVPRIEVEFRFDENQTLHVTAKDLTTGSSVKKDVKIDKGVQRETSKARAYDIVLLLDSSYSMNGDDLVRAKQACDALVSDMIDLSVNRVGLITFGSYSTILSNLTQDKALLKSEIAKVSASGSTNMTKAIKDAESILSESLNEAITILVTDGDPDNQSETLTRARLLKEQSIRLITVGVGAGVNSQYLTKIATSADDYYYVENMSQLHGIFEKITNALQTV